MKSSILMGLEGVRPRVYLQDSKARTKKLLEPLHVGGKVQSGREGISGVSGVYVVLGKWSCFLVTGKAKPTAPDYGVLLRNYIAILLRHTHGTTWHGTLNPKPQTLTL